jgi:hypothetical protein
MDTRNARLLDLYTDYLLVSFGQTTATGLAALIPDLSHDQVTRFLAQKELTEKDLWRIVKPHLRQIQSDDAVLILDDSIEEKPYTDPSELICTHFDHVTGRYVKGINLMSCLYLSDCSQGVSLPVNFHLIQKTELVQDPKTGKDKWQSPINKNEIARQMIASAINRQIPFRYVLNDIWFSSAENMVFIKGKKKDFVMPLKSNRKVALSEALKKQGKWQRIDSLSFETDSPMTVHLESVPFALLLYRQVFANEDGSQGILYLVTSDLSLSASSMTTIYQKRWKVEEYHKSLKSNASFAKSPTKRIRTQSNHFFACLVAFVKLETYRAATTLNHFALKAKLYQTALASAFRELQNLKATCHTVVITA